jgi:hypothetical protein
MSLATKRQEIVDCLNAIDGVKGYKTQPSAPKPGDAWVRAGARVREDGLFETTWQVMVMLPQSETSADVWRDNHEDDLWDGLECPADLPSAGYVESIEPANFAASDNQIVFGLLITLRSE